MRLTQTVVSAWRYWRHLWPAHRDIQERRAVPVARRLRGLRGMAWSAAAVLYLRKTASALSRLGCDGVTSGAEGSSGAHGARPNSKIMSQYLRGERCPTPGPRGKWRFDLVGAVHSMRNGAVARLYLDSPLWALLDSKVSLETARGILCLTHEHLCGMPWVDYIRAWAAYRIAVAEGRSPVEQQECAHHITTMHLRVRHQDPVFNFLCLPLEAYLRLCEPGIPFRLADTCPKRRTPAIKSLAKALDDMTRSERRFADGLERYLRSGKSPDRRFLKIYRERWKPVLAWLHVVRSALVDAPEPDPPETAGSLRREHLDWWEHAHLITGPLVPGSDQALSAAAPPPVACPNGQIGRALKRIANESGPRGGLTLEDCPVTSVRARWRRPSKPA
jgi:hypothetical protein